MSAITANPDIIIRKTANYHPSIWGDFFITFMPDQTNINAWSEDAKHLKEEVRNRLKEHFNGKEIREKLGMIDAVERLGIGYHFEAEIAELLNKIFEIYNTANNQQHQDRDLVTVALLFRLLRQHHINISCDILSKFKDMKGCFNKDLGEDNIEGILCLYEATYLRVHGDKILEEALAFTKPILESKVSSQLTPYFGELVTNALRRPVRKAHPRVASSQYISIYQLNELHNQTLLKLAKIDFNLLQLQHIEELRIISMWWRDLDVEKTFSFARNRITELYLWILGVYYEPQYELSRRFLCKVIGILSILDDTYDVYGTPAELELFTQAVQTWDRNAEDQFPEEYMKVTYRVLLKVYDEMEEELAKNGTSYAISYSKQGMKRTTKGYLEETKWLLGTKIPTMEEYLKISCVSTCYPMLAVTALVGMGEIATKEAFDWFMNVPQIVTAASLICRLMDDIVSHQLERKREHVPSGVECYMNEHSVTADEAYENFNTQIENAWVDMNEAFMDRRSPSAPLLTRVLNLARVIDLLYKEEDSYTHSHKIKHLVTALFVTPLPI